MTPGISVMIELGPQVEAYVNDTRPDVFPFAVVRLSEASTSIVSEDPGLLRALAATLTSTADTLEAKQAERQAARGEP